MAGHEALSSATVVDEGVHVTRSELKTLLEQVKPSPADVAEGFRLYRASQEEQEASRSAQERLVMGAFGSWLKRHWKMATGLSAILATVATGGWQGWGWLQLKAEQQVLERQASDKQSTAVEANTAAVDEVTRIQGDLAERVGGVEKKVEANSQINQLLLQLQLRDPKTKRTIKGDEDLQKKVEAITGSKVE